MKLLLLFCTVSCASACYWNAECPYLLYSTRTPYDTVRGDIRDHNVPKNCEAVSIWTLHRHGNRKPCTSETESIKYIASLKDDIVASYHAGTSQLCAQDIENFRKWTWNTTLEVSQCSLTNTGYKELFDIGARIKQKYPHLLQGSNEDYYFRPTNEQRIITSGQAFVNGLTEGTNLTVVLDQAIERDYVIMPYEYCDRYLKTVLRSKSYRDQLDAYYHSEEYIKVQSSIQQRLGISTTLSAEDIYAFYELCRFDRSWVPVHQSPWCAVFSEEDLVVMGYCDDVRHYHKNGYHSWVNIKLGRRLLKDLYENFEAAVNGQGKKIISYFSHATMLEMVYSAMGIFQDSTPLQGSYRDPRRLWQTSKSSPWSANIIAVLNSCTESGNESYRVQLFVNEKVTELCPLEGCTWEQFQEKFQGFTAADLDFCSMEYR